LWKAGAVANFATALFFASGNRTWLRENANACKCVLGFRPYLGKNFSDAGDAHGTVPRNRKVFPDGALASAIRQGLLPVGSGCCKFATVLFLCKETESGFERMLTFAHVSTVSAVRRAHPFFVSGNRIRLRENAHVCTLVYGFRCASGAPGALIWLVTPTGLKIFVPTFPAAHFATAGFPQAFALASCAKREKKVNCNQNRKIGGN